MHTANVIFFVSEGTGSRAQRLRWSKAKELPSNFSRAQHLRTAKLNGCIQAFTVRSAFSRAQRLFSKKASAPIVQLKKFRYTFTTMKKGPVKLIKAALTERLHMDPRKNHVRLTIEDSCVVMEGFVDGIALKKRALLIAMGMKDVEGVIDRLRVRPSMNMTDAEIQAHIYDAFAEEPTLASCELRIEAANAVVDLEGTVGSLTHKRLAGALAWWVPGVVDVINSIEVAPHEEDSDDEVVDAVRLIFEKDPIVHLESIHVSAANWIVTLSGVAPGETGKIASEEDALYVWGVNEVVKTIAVRRPAARPAAAKETNLTRPYRPHRLPLKKP